MGCLSKPQWEIYARELVEVELSCMGENMEAQREALRHRAYQRAGYAGNSNNARRLANHRIVKKRFRELFAEAMEYRDVRIHKVVIRIDRVGGANILDFYDEHGQLKPLAQMPRELTEAIKKVELDHNGRVVNIELHDKNQANFTLLKHLGGLREDRPPAANVNILSVLSVDDQRALAEALEALPAAGADNSDAVG